MPGPLAGMGLGILKSELVDRPKEMRQREIAATTAALSPWTGLKAQPVQEANWQEAAMSGAAAGMGQEQQEAAAAEALKDQQQRRKLMEAQTAYYGTRPTGSEDYSGGGMGNEGMA